MAGGQRAKLHALFPRPLGTKGKVSWNGRVCPLSFEQDLIDVSKVTFRDLKKSFPALSVIRKARVLSLHRRYTLPPKKCL